MSKVVLIVDDSIVSRMMVKEIVKSQIPEVTIVEAGGGEQCLSQITTESKIDEEDFEIDDKHSYYISKHRDEWRLFSFLTDKLSYIFDNVIKKNQAAFKATNTIVAWDIEGYFRKSLIMAEAGGYIKFLSKIGAITLQIDNKGRGLITLVEESNRFESYIGLVKKSKYKETDFKSPNLGCDLNEY